MSSQSEPEIIKSENVQKELQKSLGSDKIFKFSCDIEYDKLRIGLKEINCYSPYYYETFFTLEELQKKNAVFKACKTLKEVQNHLLTLFGRDTAFLKSLDNDKQIQICLKMYDISKKIDEDFILERKTIENKDKSLMFLFAIQKDNIKLFERIKQVCQEEKYKGEKLAGKIVTLLTN